MEKKIDEQTHPLYFTNIKSEEAIKRIGKEVIGQPERKSL